MPSRQLSETGPAEAAVSGYATLTRPTVASILLVVPLNRHRRRRPVLQARQVPGFLVRHRLPLSLRHHTGGRSVNSK